MSIKLCQNFGKFCYWLKICMTTKPFHRNLPKNCEKALFCCPQKCEKSPLPALRAYSICKKQHNADYVAKRWYFFVQSVLFTHKLYVVIFLYNKNFDAQFISFFIRKAEYKNLRIMEYFWQLFWKQRRVGIRMSAVSVVLFIGGIILSLVGN